MLALVIMIGTESPLSSHTFNPIGERTTIPVVRTMEKVLPALICDRIDDITTATTPRKHWATQPILTQPYLRSCMWASVYNLAYCSGLLMARLLLALLLLPPTRQLPSPFTLLPPLAASAANIRRNDNSHLSDELEKPVTGWSGEARLSSSGQVSLPAVLVVARD